VGARGGHRPRRFGGHILIGVGAPHEANEEHEATEDDVIAREHIARDRSMVRQGRRMAGTPGAMMAGAMIALRDIYEPPRDERIVATAESPTEPVDVDREGVQLPAAEVEGVDDLEVPAQPRRAPLVARRRGRR
jgi:hypothetical protein